MSHPYPILRVELDGIKHRLMLALSERELGISGVLSDAIDRLATPENIQRIVDEAAKEAIEASVSEAVKSWFRYGPGQSAIKEAVAKRLEQDAQLMRA